MVKLWRTVRDLWQSALPLPSDRIRAKPLVAPGLYTYRLQPTGGQIRIHLRVEPSGTGTLFVDVTEVIHLNATAVEIAKWTLDGEEESTIAKRLFRQFAVPWKRCQSDVRAITRMIDRFREPSSGCPTCELGDLQRADLFQTPIRAPFKADLAITYACNNDCPHCYNEIDRLTLKSMSLADWRKVVDRLVEVGIPHLIFTGGEASLYPELPELIAYADARGPICGLNSNGRRFAQATFARRMAESGLNHLQVTLGSHRGDVHDRMMNAHCFDQTVRGIRQAMDAGIHTITNTTLMRMNAEEITDTVEFLYGLGIRTFAINGMIYSGGGF
ncbi:MAG TPA: radical SAM protein, partial [Pirellulaceae bacterium]